MNSDKGNAKRVEVNAALSAVQRKLNVSSGPGVRVTNTPNGSVAVLVPPQGGLRRGGSVNRHPFQLSGVVEGAEARISIRPGSVNNAVPKIGSTSLVAVPAPYLVVTGSSGTIYLHAAVDSNGVITNLVALNTSGNVPSDTSGDKYKLVGTWTSGGGQFTSVSSILNDNQSLFVCNGTAIWGT